MTGVIAAPGEGSHTSCVRRATDALLPRIFVCGLLMLDPVVARAQAGPAASQAPTPATTAFVRNWTRAEAWHFFEPPPGGGDHTYADIANRLQIGLRRAGRKYEWVGALQYVQFGGLPTRAVGPGPLGVGAAYFDHSGDRNSHQIYLRYLNLTIKDLAPGLRLQAGRIGYTSGAEAASGNPKIETVKRQRVDSRLIGDFEWALYQRAYDGVRADWARPSWHATAAALRPTQGGFEERAGIEIDRISLFAASATLRPGRPIRHTDAQIFAYRYNDDRNVRARPDNTGRVAPRVDVRVYSVGATLVGAYPRDGGEADAMIWVVGQGGTWYAQRHRAFALAAEAGYQWTGAAGRPWLRAGGVRASGDADPADGRHGTFFQMMPTVRRYSQSATYSLMNLNDVFVQASVRPTRALSLRVDAHRLALAEAADRWYFGSGATQKAGSNFGYGTRPSHGARALGTVVEASADYTMTRYWSVNGYVGFIKGGTVVRRSFAGDRLTFAYVESVFQF